MSPTEIARGLGVSAGALNKHCAEELASGAAKYRMEVVEMLFKKARSGNVTAMRTLESMTAQTLAAISRPSRKEPRLGKKVAADQAANLPGAADGTSWAELLRN